MFDQAGRLELQRDVQCLGHYCAIIPEFEVGLACKCGNQDRIGFKLEGDRSLIRQYK